MGVRANIAESLGMPVDAVTRSFMFVLGTLIVYLAVGGIEFIPFPADMVFALLFIVFWLGYPVALHYDKKYVAQHSSGWTPSKWYYLGFLPGYLGLVFVGYYVYKRKDAFNSV